ncbi:onanonoxo-7-onima-8-eninoihtemlysoneda [Hysterangium stoloniferum]|nr:onanonoxo-7-onima-8-eninoihtemlysoneda [Hysterangium stoloniferum]
MTRLYKHLRIHQIFGANTDVGKTILTTALCRASAARNKRVFYLKPVSTGAPQDADDEHIVRFSGREKKLQTNCLFRYSEPVSPHLAVERDNREIISDEKLVNAVAHHITTCATKATDPAVMYVETAGGVNSPVMSGSTQVNAYRSLYLPTILVGDAKLGGISTTISAYESLLLRGYQVDLVTMFVDHYHQNFNYLQQYFAEQRIPFYCVDPPPPRQADQKNDQSLTEEYYSSIVNQKNRPMVYEMEEDLDKSHIARLTNLESMSTRTLDSIWWPFEQHKLVKPSDVTVIDSAHGDFLSVFSTLKSKSESSLLNPMLDGSASWWTQILGHAHPSLTLAAAKAAGRYGHVIFPQATHLPALKLAETLIHKGPGNGWASRAFFTDDGSTGMEVALKMALRATTKRDGWQKHTNPELVVLGLKGSYHGDTIGAMDACEGFFTCEWHNSKGYWLDPPVIGIRDDGVRITLPQSWRTSEDGAYMFDSVTAVYDVEQRLDSPLAQCYHQFIGNTLSRIQKPGQPKLAALVIEPLLMGAGGMIFVDPLFQRVLVDTVRGVTPNSSRSQSEGWTGLPVIFDEVFVGLYRLGVRSCSSILGVNPDIAVFAKNLTGGLVPMAVTLANNSIYEAFLGDTKAEALLHGHSYTAHPVGCEVANETLTKFEELVSNSSTWKLAKKNWSSTEDTPTERRIWSFWEKEFVNQLAAHPNVEEAMALGTVLAFKIRDDTKGYVSASAQSSLSFLRNKSMGDDVNVPFGVHYRTLGNVAYFMCSLNTDPKTLRTFESALLSGL